MPIPSDHLDTLLVVLSEGTFDAAAQRLHVTPSAVSQRIKAMEQQAGRVLVQRTNPIQATEAGRAIVQYAQQVRLLSNDLDRALTGASSTPALAVAVNADSLATWFLPAVINAHESLGVVFDIHREDQQHTASLLRSGTVLAAVTSEKRPVQGCTSTPLGTMVYRAVATPAFRDRWLGEGIGGLADAPMVEFDRRDALQRDFVHRHVARTATPPSSYVPTSADFARSVTMGLGWGMLPDQQSADELAAGQLVELAPDDPHPVELHWQRWNLSSPLLDELTRIVVAAAGEALT